MRQNRSGYFTATLEIQVRIFIKIIKISDMSTFQKISILVVAFLLVTLIGLASAESGGPAILSLGGIAIFYLGKSLFSKK